MQHKTTGYWTRCSCTGESKYCNTPQQVDDFLASQHEGGTTTCRVTRKGKTGVGKTDKPTN